MLKIAKYLLGVAAVAGWLAFALSPKEPVVARDAGPPDLDHDGLEVARLEGEVFARSEALGLPVDAEIVGGDLVLLDHGGAGVFHSVDLVSGDLVTFGTEGEGPGEFAGAWSLDPLPGRPAFGVWDIGLQRWTRVELEGGRPAGPLRESPTASLRSSAAVTGLVAVGERAWLGLGFFPDGRWGEFDEAGRLTRSYGALPGSGSGLPVTVLQQAYTGTPKARPDRRLVAVGARYAGRLEIHDVASRSSILAEVPFPFEPRVHVREGTQGPVMATGDDVRFGYIDVEAAPERIYALFSGRTPAGFPDRPNFGEHVHVFDWSGRFVGAVRLEADAIGLAVDEGAGLLYAVSHDPAPAVWRYGLKDWLAAAR